MSTIADLRNAIEALTVRLDSLEAMVKEIVASVLAQNEENNDAASLLSPNEEPKSFQEFIGKFPALGEITDEDFEQVKRELHSDPSTWKD